MKTFALRGSRIKLEAGIADGLALMLRGDTILSIVPENDVPACIETRELDGGILFPGFIDTQVNGGGGLLFNEVPSVDGLRVIAESHRRFGTTGFLATIISDELSVISNAMRAVEEAMDQDVPGLLGIHIEGPMLAPLRHGIHKSNLIRNPTRELIELMCSLRCGRTLVTLAPEVARPDTIRALVNAGVIVAAGHTEATYEQMQEGFAAGITGVTHLFNAMSPLTNRAPGAVGGALDNQEAWCGLIVDGVHVHPAALRVALRSRPIDRFMLVTDAMPPVGTNFESFQLQGRPISVSGDRCIDENGTLAGTNLTMDAAVRNLVELVGLPLETASSLASHSPAAFLGLDSKRGTIAPGQTADLVWMSEDMQVRGTWIAARQAEGNDA